VPIPVPLPMFSFTGTRGSFMGDAHFYGKQVSNRASHSWLRHCARMLVMCSVLCKHNSADVPNIKHVSFFSAAFV
jgi:hypothetical protein